MNRVLRSKAERALLWYAAHGRCQRCGVPLPERWHADHVIPWYVTQRTNVHEMQALCSRCNLHKGSMMKRTFQTQIDQFVQDLLAEAIGYRSLCGSITPGGGKGSIPLILAQLLPRFAQKICIVTPRVTLAAQAEHVFVSPLMQRLFPHTARIRHDTNTPNPTRGLEGYSTTYQAISMAPGLHASEFARHRYVLVLDEVHHVKTHFEQPEHPEFAWSRALQPLADQAALIVFTSGTLYRHDKKPIFGFPYKDDGQGGYVVDFPEGQTVQYGRRDALYQKAIVPLYFTLLDAQAKWKDKNGTPIERATFDETSYEAGQMLEATLDTEFARHLLAATVEHWQSHRQQFPRAKLLVVAPRITLAKRYAAWLKADHGLTARIATSDDSKDAHEAIALFRGRRKPELDVLVTVGSCT